ncbi:WD repeat domain 74 lethal (2) k09848 [Halictus rubicundus]|uniref:WD repeat domain 74 lethal (2) k09848 n=1 Tax=Halictus rubicundus TaxID=77578 RepID=UPI0040375044
MCSKDNYDIYTGCKSGVFKGIKIEKEQCIMQNIQSLVSITDNDSVTAISWGDNEEKEILIACGTKEIRSVKVYDTECSTFTCSFFCNVGTGKVNGISRYDEAILTAVQSGEVKLWRFKDGDGILINAGEDLERMRHSKIDKSIIATGGKENILKLFDLGRQEQVFAAKRLPNDWLNLPVGIWISDIDFLPGTEQVVTVGRYGHVQLYDPKTQRRPVVNLEVKDEALTTLAVTSREKQIIVGSGKGKMNLVDLRKPAKVLNTYKGFAGAVTGITCSTTEPYIVSVSLDRYLRVHHMNTKKLLKKIYSTSKMSCMLLRSGFSLPEESQITENGERMHNDRNSEYNNSTNKKNGKTAVDSDSEYDMLFENMQVINNREDKKLIKRKKVISLDNETLVSKAASRKYESKRRKPNYS